MSQSRTAWGTGRPASQRRTCRPSRATIRRALAFCVESLRFAIHYCAGRCVPVSCHTTSSPEIAVAKMPKMPKAPMLNPAHKGRLHKALHVPANEPIPAPKLAKALKSPNPHMRQMANFAKVAKGFQHPGDGDAVPVAHTSKHH